MIAGLTFWLGLGAILCASLFYATPSVAALARTSPLVVCRRSVRGRGRHGPAIWSGLRAVKRTIRVAAGICRCRASPSRSARCFSVPQRSARQPRVLFVLLPGGHGIDYPSFLADYVFACLVGIASHAPGGLGVFEATMLVALSRLPSSRCSARC